MNYKLIKKLPFEQSPEIGYISKPMKRSAHYWNHNWFDPEDYPEYWEKVVEKDYEILEIAFEDGDICDYAPHSKMYSSKKEFHEYFLNSNCNYKIHSIKRLSDGEVFTVGIDECNNKHGNFGVIAKFEDIRGELHALDKTFAPRGEYVYGLKVSSLIRKELIFTTEDGVGIFEDTEECWEVLNSDKSNVYRVLPNNFFTLKNVLSSRKVFSTKEAAEEYVLFNKTSLSLEDVFSVYPRFKKESNLHTKHAKDLIDLVKRK